jgi:hypothetical protein
MRSCMGNTSNAALGVALLVSFLSAWGCQGTGSVPPDASGGSSESSGGVRTSDGSGGRAPSGGAPTSTGGVPASTGGVPANTGGVPVNTGGVPVNTGGVPAAGGRDAGAGEAGLGGEAGALSTSGGGPSMPEGASCAELLPPEGLPSGECEAPDFFSCHGYLLSFVSVFCTCLGPDEGGPGVWSCLL